MGTYEDLTKGLGNLNVGNWVLGHVKMSQRGVWFEPVNEIHPTKLRQLAVSQTQTMQTIGWNDELLQSGAILIDGKIVHGERF